MRHYWSNLNQREQWLVLLTGGIAILYLFYLLICSPLSTALVAKSQQLREKQQTLNWMEQAQINKDKKKTETVSSSQLLTLIANQLGDHHLQKFSHQLQQTNQGDIQLSFESVPYKLFLTWLWSLNNQYTMTFKQLSIENTPKKGLVKASILIGVS